MTSRPLILIMAISIAAAFTLASAEETTAARRSADASTTPSLSLPPPGEARLIDDDGIRNLLVHHGKRLLVVNFWATYCAPCIEEIPRFIEVYNEFKNKDVLFVGLSADFPDGWQDLVFPFLKDHKVPYPNFVLDVDPNVTIPRFSKAWSGSLPATFYYDARGNQVGARLGQVDKETLREDIWKHLRAQTGG